MDNKENVTVHIGLVKQVVSDNIIVQGQYEKGKAIPTEKRLGFSNITIPKLGLPARVLPNGVEVNETTDEPWAFEAREFLRKTCVGRTVFFIIDYVVPGSNRELASIYIDRQLSFNIAELLVANGLAVVRDGPTSNEAVQKLLELEVRAKERHNGRWSGKANVRHGIKWSVDVDTFFQEHKNVSLNGVVEHVRDGINFRVQILPSHAYINLTLSGVNCPPASVNASSNNPLNDARSFSECRLLQQDVKVILHSPNGQNGFYGSMLHKFGDIAVHLLGYGLVQICEWNLKCVKDPALYRRAESLAKEHNFGIWKDYSSEDLTPSSAVQYAALVVGINGGDSLQVRKEKEGNVEVIHLSSIRPPRVDVGQKINYALFDIPYFFEARECLRKLIGKKVNVTVDYKSTVTGASPNAGQKRTYCTVFDGKRNVAVSLVEQGLASVVRYRPDDDKRSPYYSELLEAENNARTNELGLHSKREAVPMRVIDLAGDMAKSHLPLLKQAGKMKAIVEWVMSGSRFRLLIPSQNVILSFALAYISCPRTSITVKPGSTNVRQSEQFGDEAFNYTKDLCFQRDVSVVIEGMDRSNCFTGILYTNPNSKSDECNLALCLLRNGLAHIHPLSARNGSIYRQLQDAADVAKTNRIGVWSIETASSTEEEETDEPRFIVPVRAVYISNVLESDLHVFVQHESFIERTLNLLDNLKETLNSTVYDPDLKLRKNLLVAADLPEDGWARVQIKSIGESEIEVFAIDYGKFYNVKTTDLRPLPGQFVNMRPAAQEVVLAFVRPSTDEDHRMEAIQLLCEYSHDCSTFEMKTYFKMNDIDYVVLMAGNVDVNKELLANGLVTLAKEKQVPARCRKSEIYESYKLAEESAKKARLNVWQYGNCGDDDDDY